MGFNMRTQFCKNSFASVSSSFLISPAASLLWYRSVLPVSDRASLATPAAGVYLWLGPVAIALQLVGWIAALAAKRLTSLALGAVTIGAVGFALCVIVLREVLRLGRMNLDALVELHQAEAHVGGLFVFLAFFVVNAVVITYCVVLVRRGLAARSTS